MEVSNQIKAKPPGIAKKTESKEPESTTPVSVAAAPQPVEKAELKEVEREKSEKKVENTEHLNALKEAFDSKQPAATKKPSTANPGEAGEDESKSPGKAKGHSKAKGKGKAKGHAKAKGHSKGKGKAKGHAKKAATATSEPKKKAESKKPKDSNDVSGSLKDPLDKLTAGRSKDSAKAKQAVKELEQSQGKSGIKNAEEAAEKLNESNSEAADKAKDALGKLKDSRDDAAEKAQARLEKTPPGQEKKEKATEAAKNKPKEVVRTEARQHTQKSVESRQEATRQEQRSVGKAEVVQTRTRAIRQSAPVAPKTEAPKLEQPKIEQREEPSEAPESKPEKLEDRKPLKVAVRPEEQKPENLPLATSGSTQTRVQISPESSDNAVDTEVEAQNQVGQENRKALERSSSLEPKASDRNEQLEKAQRKTSLESQEKLDQLQSGQNQLGDDQKTVIRAEESQGEAKQRVLDGSQRVHDAGHQIMTRQHQIHEAGAAVSEAKLEVADAGGMEKKADVRLEDAVRRFHQGKLEDDDDKKGRGLGRGKTKEERDAVLRQAVTSAEEFQEKAQARSKVASQREIDAKKGVVVATDRLAQDQDGLRKSETHLDSHQENAATTRDDFQTAVKNVESGKDKVTDHRQLVGKLTSREAGIQKESEQNLAVLQHLRESSEPLQENLLNQQENVEKLEARKTVPGQSNTIELKEMREVPTPYFGSSSETNPELTV